MATTDWDQLLQISEDLAARVRKYMLERPTSLFLKDVLLAASLAHARKLVHLTQL